jgi:hypothetical protein
VRVTTAANALARYRDKRRDVTVTETPPETDTESEQNRKKEQKAARAALESDFETWYSAYPRKVAKAKALKAYIAARKKTDAETLLAGVETYLKTKPDYADWAHPATWLNGERWLDEPTEAPKDEAQRIAEKYEAQAALERGTA